MTGSAQVFSLLARVYGVGTPSCWRSHRARVRRGDNHANTNTKGAHPPDGRCGASELPVDLPIRQYPLAIFALRIGLKSRQRRGQPSWAVSSSVESANAMTASDANSAANVTRSAITNCFGLRQGKDLGQKQTCAAQKVMSALPPKADMCGATRDVRFVPIADILTWMEAAGSRGRFRQ